MTAENEQRLLHAVPVTHRVKVVSIEVANKDKAASLLDQVHQVRDGPFRAVPRLAQRPCRIRWGVDVGQADPLEMMHVPGLGGDQPTDLKARQREFSVDSTQRLRS